MILLLGGTKETASITQSLAAAGYEVLVSTATDIPLEVGSDPKIRRRAGELKKEGMAALIRELGIKGIVDVTHPYAQVVRATARKVAEQAAIPYLTLIRPSTIHEREGILWAVDHDEAARRAFSFGQPVFLTIGSKNLAPYVWESRNAGIPMVVRVLPYADSLKACHSVSISKDFVLAERGPFSVEENRSVIQRFKIGVLVTKDSGVLGGVPEKLEAARLEGCQVIVVKRPDHSSYISFDNLSDLIAAVSMKISKNDAISCGGQSSDACT